MPNLHLSAWTISSSQMCMNFNSCLNHVIEYLGWDPTYQTLMENMGPCVFSNSRAQMCNDSATTELCNHQEEDRQFHTRKLVSTRPQICILMWMASTWTHGFTSVMGLCSLIQYGYEWTKEQQIYLIDLQILNHSFMGKDLSVRCIAYLQTQQSKTKWIPTTLNNILPSLNWYFSYQHYLISQAVDEEPKSHTVSHAATLLTEWTRSLQNLSARNGKKPISKRTERLLELVKLASPSIPNLFAKAKSFFCWHCIARFIWFA